MTSRIRIKDNLKDISSLRATHLRMARAGVVRARLIMMATPNSWSKSTVLGTSGDTGDDAVEKNCTATLA